MQIHEIIEDDLTIHYLFQVNPEDMKAIKEAMKYAAENTFLPPGAALVATILGNYPITTYQEKLDAIPPLKDPE